MIPLEGAVISVLISVNWIGLDLIYCHYCDRNVFFNFYMALMIKSGIDDQKVTENSMNVEACNSFLVYILSLHFLYILILLLHLGNDIGKAIVMDIHASYTLHKIYLK